MKKILVLAAVLGFGFATLGYADVTPTTATPAVASHTFAKKHHKHIKHSKHSKHTKYSKHSKHTKYSKHTKHVKHTKKAAAPMAAPMAVATKAAN